MDICGPYPIATPSGKRYFHSILDDCSNFGFTALLRTRSEAPCFYVDTETYLERASGFLVKAVRLDGAPELSAGTLGAHLKARGIAVQVTAPYAHSQNGKAERYIRTLEDGGQALLADSGLPGSFWGDAVLTMQYVRNRVPTSTLPVGFTPYEILHKKKPDLSHLCVWGCQCFVAIPGELRDKVGPRRFEAIFVGYEENRVGWRVRDLQGTYHFSRDIVFNESSAGHLHQLPRSLPPPADIASRPSRQRILDIAGPQYDEVLDLAHSMRRNRLTRELRALHDGAGSSLPVPAADGGAVARRSSRIAARSSLALSSECLSVDLVSFFATFPCSADSCVLSLNTLEPNTFLTARFSPFVEFPFSFDPTPLSTLAASTPASSRTITWDLKKEPKSFAEACAHPDAHAWCAAMDREIVSLKGMNTFVECDLPSGRKPLDLKWVYAQKTDTDGNNIAGKEKARLVAMGFRQRPEDFGETAAPVAKMTSVRILLAWAAVQDWHIFQFDCKTVFLHAWLCHDVYCRPFSGWPVSHPKKVLRILAALYGLRQSAYEFYMLFFSLLVGLGMSRCECDHGVFFGEWSTPPDPSIPMPSDNSLLILLVPLHVDDGLGITNSEPLYLWFLKSLSHRLHVVDLGPCSKFLNILIIRDHSRRRLWLSSHLYVSEHLTDWNMTHCKPTSTPLASPIVSDPVLPMRCPIYPMTTLNPNINTW